MQAVIQIKPDIDFLRQVKKSSRAPLKQCMQCGNCTAVCKLSQDEQVFPRREMMWAAWGLKDRIIGNPNIWLCHQCGDCMENCPRDVKPSDVLSTLRQINYLWYAKPNFLGKWLSKPVYLPLIVLFPVLIITIILYFAGSFNRPELDYIDYSAFFPHVWLNSSFTSLTFLSFLGAYIGIRKFWKDMKFNMSIEKKNSITKSFISVLKEIGTHSKFNSCSSSKDRYYAHLMMFWGFILLLFVTLVAIINVIFFDYPMKFFHPAKIAGNFSSILLFTGIGIMIFNRLFNKKLYGHSNYYDWYFLISLFLLTLSGTLTEIARFLNWQTAYYIYFFHLLMVWMVIIYAPFSKFGHFIFRTVALVFVKSRGK